MKKIIITLSVLFLSFNYSYAGSCKIQYSTSPALLKYIENNRSVIKNIVKGVVNSKPEENTIKNQAINQYEKYSGYLVKSFNKSIDFTGYQSYFEYYIVYPISGEVPSEIRRDYRLLENEKKGLNKYLNSLIENNKGDIIIKNTCSGLKNCNYNNKTTTEIVSDLILNLNNFMDFYRLIVMGTPSDFNGNINLISSENIIQIKSDYSPKSYEGCVTKKEGFFDTIIKAIKQIKLYDANFKEGIKEWKQAWALLVGNTSISKTAKLEQESLKKELSRQGVYGSDKLNFYKAKNEFNQKGLSLNNNFITNTFAGVYEKVKSQLRVYKSEKLDTFLEKEDKNVSINKVQEIESNFNTDLEISNRIKKLYESQTPFGAINNYNNDNLNSRIINTHNELSKTIDKLEGTIKKSKSVCKSQDGSKGNCN